MAIHLSAIPRDRYPEPAEGWRLSGGSPQTKPLRGGGQETLPNGELTTEPCRRELAASAISACSAVNLPLPITGVGLPNEAYTESP